MFSTALGMQILTLTNTLKKGKEQSSGRRQIMSLYSSRSQHCVYPNLIWNRLVHASGATASSDLSHSSHIEKKPQANACSSENRLRLCSILWGRAFSVSQHVQKQHRDSYLTWMEQNLQLKLLQPVFTVSSQSGCCKQALSALEQMCLKKKKKNSTCLHSSSSAHIITIMHLITV